MVKINQFEVENVKRVKAVAYDCSGDVLTIIGGNNAQGKTSVLDAIMWTLGGDRYKPGNAVRDGQEKMATKVTLSNGIIVERRGQGSLKVTSPDGKGGQALLNEFVNQFALDLPKFMQATDGEKARMLLDLYPELGVKLDDLNQAEKKMYEERHAMGQIATRKAKHAEDLPYIEGLPEEPLSGKAMTDKLQAALAVNARNAETRRRLAQVERQAQEREAEIERQKRTVSELEQRLEQERERLSDMQGQLAGMKLEITAATKETSEIRDEDTTEIEAEMERIDEINAKIRKNLDKQAAENEAQELQQQYSEISKALDDIRTERLSLLSSVEMPLDGLSISDDGKLVFNGQPWDCMSGSEQLQVAVAISSAIKPECGFVLLDGLERMDIKQMRKFAAWLGARDMQAIGTRVSTGDECSIVIEDGEGITGKKSAEAETPKRKPLTF